MKGLAPLQWTLISISLALVLATFAFLQIQNAMDIREAMKTRYDAAQGSSIINTIQAAPSVTIHTYEPFGCIEIDEKVRAESKKFEYTVELIRTELVIVSEGEICNKAEFTKNNDIVNIEEMGESNAGP